MSHARIEELSDSDPDIDDPSDFLSHDDQSIIAPADIPSTSSSRQPANQRQAAPYEPEVRASPLPPGAQLSQTSAEARKSIRPYQSLYPVYFDSTRTRSQGRRVNSKHAIPNPLAYNLLAAARDACGSTPLQLAFEPDRSHPKDWSNPGRVRILMFDKDTHRPLHPKITNKRHLYALVGKYLVDNPTQKTDPTQLVIQGLPIPDKFTETEIPKPRGWKMGGILPVHSPAVSGGGVKDDFFKEAMEELRQAQASGQLPAGGGGGPGGMGMGMPGGAGGMPDMSALQSMMSGMGGMGGMGGLGGMGGAGGMGAGSGAGPSKKKKEKKKG